MSQPSRQIEQETAPEHASLPPRRIILIDDDRLQRISAAQTLELAGCDVEAFADPQLALQRVERDFAGAVITDMRMPGLDGMAVLAAIRAKDPDLPVILVTGYGDVPLAVDAMRHGAYDFLEKPFRPDLLVEVAARAIEKRALVMENRSLHKALSEATAGHQAHLVGASPQIERLRGLITEIAAVPVDVLIRGEPGVEAEQVARAILAASPADGGPFEAVYCSRLSGGMAELELFGSAREGGTASTGRIAQAKGGALYLEDVDQLPDAVRLRVEGLSRDAKLGARLIMSRTSPQAEPFEREAKSQFGIVGEFSGAIIDIPPVRLRGQDRIHIFQHCLDTAAVRFTVDPPNMSDAETRAIMLYDWPGNLPEMKAQAERFALGMGLTIAAGEQTAPIADEALPDRVAAFERTLIAQELHRSGGSVKATYMALGIPRKTLQDKMKKYGLRRDDFVSRN